jgi:hypothetical protein
LQQITGNRPLPGVLFGITHTTEGAAIVREPRVLKVGIGLPKGRGVNVWIHHDKRWYFRMGQKSQDGRIKLQIVEPKGFGTRQEAEKFYREHAHEALELPAPHKLPYFTFSRPVMQKDGREMLEPDFAAIEAHGPTPSEIDVVFLDDNPFTGAYQMWSATELLCTGDGVTARRVFKLAANDAEKALAEQIREQSKGREKYFPIVDGCAMNGCSYRDEVVKGNRSYPSPCKPGGSLRFQLANNIRVGGTAYYHTTGYRSISQIFSCIEQIKALTGGRLAGIPLKMVLRSYTTKHNGQSATQYAVSLEFRAEDLQALRKNLIEQAFRFRQLAGVPTPRAAPALIEAPGESVIEEGEEEEEPVAAQTMADEFYSGRPDDDGDGGLGDPAEETSAPKGAEAATSAKTAALAEKLAKQQAKRPPAESPATAPAPDPAATQAAGVQVVDDVDRTPEDPEDPRFQKQPGDLI